MGMFVLSSVTEAVGEQVSICTVLLLELQSSQKVLRVLAKLEILNNHEIIVRNNKHPINLFIKRTKSQRQ